jgi:uncharacterized protein YbjT (DUF2867 family)
MGMNLLLVGASGLAGQGVLNVLLGQADVANVTVLVRRPLVATSPKLRVLQVPEFTDDALANLDLAGLDACLYCAGALPLLLSEAAYREVTVALLERVCAAYASANPGGYLVYVSGAGADAASRFMPLRVKGEAEAVPGRFGLASTSLRPGVIRPTQGERSPHAFRRAMYALGSPLLALARHLWPAGVTTTAALGHCMLALARAAPRRPAVLGNRQINARAPR